MKTRLTELLGIEYPIIQGGMQWIATAEFAAAVSNAGGLGIINATRFQDKESLVEELRLARSLTDKPFALNISMLPKKDVKDNTAMYFEAAFEAGVPIVETSGRNPGEFIGMCHDHNIKVIHKVPAVRYAKTVQREGVDAVSIVGFECAGHPGMDDVSTFALIPQAADSLDIPFAAGGGIADARGFMAALALGADGVVMGTRFVATEECPIHPNFKQRLLDTDEFGTMLVQRSLRNANRVVKNEAAQKTLDMENHGATLQELLTVISGKIQRKCYETGDTEGCLFPIGQCSGIIHEIVTIKQVFDEITGNSMNVLDRLKETLTYKA